MAAKDWENLPGRIQNLERELSLRTFFLVGMLMVAIGVAVFALLLKTNKTTEQVSRNTGKLTLVDRELDRVLLRAKQLGLLRRGRRGPPGKCPSGYVQRDVLVLTPDGSLKILGCVKL